ncbi:cytochrome c biogenesis protein ResB [Salinicoccus halitifaciens]|nr:cytochrome c biogenesis protein ResB [Salinicoccus halitifaciens]MCD2137800.1 cytochrome c biogenesis protein ResB [Salinicoccus halitifaciens]
MELKEIKCGSCGHVNPPGTQLCQSCGKMINSDYDKKKIKDLMRYDGSAIRSKTKSKSIFDKIWIFFTSIKVGVAIILIIAIASSIGTIFPQEYFIPVGADPLQYYTENYGTLGRLYYELGFHNLYSSWWFIVLIGMLALSLIAASIDRGVPLYKSLKNQRAKKHPTFYKRQRLNLQQANTKNTDGVIEGLKKKGYKVKSDNKHHLLEKGRLSRWGPYINHTGLILLLAGSMLRFFPGMYVDELIYITEGDTVQVPETEGQYYVENNDFIVDIYEEEGTVFDETVQNTNETIVSNYQTDITFYENQNLDVVGASPDLEVVEDYSLQVNHPYRFEQFELYQSSYDNTQMKSMTFQLEDSNGETVGDRFTVALDNLESTYEVGEGLAVEVRAYAPDFLEIDENGALISETPTPVNPAFIFEVTDDTSSELSLLQIMSSTDITPDNEYSVKFVENENHWATVLTLKKDLTLPLIATGFVIFLIGLFIGSYINHRRIWINDENGFNISAHTNKNYFGLKKEINPVLEENGYNHIFDRDGKDENDSVNTDEEN